MRPSRTLIDGADSIATKHDAIFLFATFIIKTNHNKVNIITRN